MTRCLNQFDVFALQNHFTVGISQTFALSRATPFILSKSCMLFVAVVLDYHSPSMSFLYNIYLSLSYSLISLSHNNSLSLFPSFSRSLSLPPSLSPSFSHSLFLFIFHTLSFSHDFPHHAPLFLRSPVHLS